MVRFLFSVLFLLYFQCSSISQSLYSIHTQWDDDIKQWELRLDDDELEGEIEMTWRLRNDMTDWSYRIDGIRGTIKQKWENNSNVWELRSGTKVVKISTVWSGDFTSFRISDGSISFKIERKFVNADPVEWEIVGENSEQFFWYNEFANDIRDWIIEDRLSDDYTLEVKLAAVFVSILHSI